MKVSRMYQIKGLGSLRKNDCIVVCSWTGMLETGEANAPYNRHNGKQIYRDGDVVVCVGKEYKRTAHYEPQPFWKVLTTSGEHATVSRGARKYFSVVSEKSKLCGHGVDSE